MNLVQVNLWSTSRLTKNSRGGYKIFCLKDIRNILYVNINVHSRRLATEFPRYGVKCISKLQSPCANMTFALKKKYNRVFQKVTHKGGEWAMNYIKIFRNAQAFSVSVGNFYSEDQLMNILLDNFHQGRKYTAQIAIHQEELRREKNVLTKNIYLLHIYRLVI